MEKKYSIFHIEGGLGKHIAATAVARCIKKNHPDRELIIVCAYPQPFLNLDFVSRVYRIGVTPYFYKDYIDQKDTLIFKHEPYFTTEHIHKTLPLIENWCKLYNLEYNGEQPELSFNDRELQKYSRTWQSQKPIFVIQSNGGLLNSESGLPYRWTRDIPFDITQQIVDKYQDQYTIYQITRPGSPVANGAIEVTNEMTSMELLSVSPKVFGYDLHDNIVAEIPEDQKLPDSYFFDYDFEGQLHDYPFKGDLFDIDTITKSLTRQSL